MRVGAFEVGVMISSMVLPIDLHDAAVDIVFVAVEVVGGGGLNVEGVGSTSHH